MTLTIQPADGEPGLRQFVTLPWTIYHADPYWVPRHPSPHHTGQKRPVQRQPPGKHHPSPLRWDPRSLAPALVCRRKI